MGWIVRSGWRNSLFLILILFPGSGLISCVHYQQPPLSLATAALVQESELRTWQEGLQAFRDGDYEKARALFEVLTETAESDELIRIAFFALASTRLVLAQTPEEFNQALVTWECWSQQFPHAAADEDPRLLTPFLERLTPPGLPEGQRRDYQPPVKKIIMGGSATCKDLLQVKDKEVERLKARLDAKEKEARRLKHQIESLEAIHLKFQERKQGVSSP